MFRLRLGPGICTIAVLLCGATLPQSATACKCVGKVAVCDAFANSDAVFSGRVESVEPDFDFWGFSGPSKKWKELSQAEFSRLEGDDSADAVKKLKEIYSEIIPAHYRVRLSRASTRRDVETIVQTVMKEGKWMRLQVQEMYKGPQQAFMDVWTDFSDCAALLLKGETYLVYAHRNDQGHLETAACSRTQRLTDAGEDLAYLHFVQHSKASGRLYGFVTSNEADLKIPRIWRGLPNPVPGMILQLESGGTRLYAETNRDGEFAFDGLARGDYAISVFDSSFPEKDQLLTAPQHVTLPDRGCVATEFYVPKSAIQQR